MVTKIVRAALVVAVSLAAWGLIGTAEKAAAAGVEASGGLNYYAQPGHPAAMYPAPRPTPPFVGRTYITYEGLYPHEFLYPHVRLYLRYNRGAGTNRTFIWWH